VRRAAYARLQQHTCIVLELHTGRVIVLQAVLAARCQHCPGRGQASSQAKHVVFCKPERTGTPRQLGQGAAGGGSDSSECEATGACGGYCASSPLGSFTNSPAAVSQPADEEGTDQQESQRLKHDFDKFMQTGHDSCGEPLRSSQVSPDKAPHEADQRGNCCACALIDQPRLAQRHVARQWCSLKELRHKQRAQQSCSINVKQVGQVQRARRSGCQLWGPRLECPDPCSSPGRQTGQCTHS